MPDASLSAMLSIADWRSFVPESIALLLLAALADQMLGSNHAVGIAALHPFWLAVILMSSQHGAMAGLFTAVLATGGYIATDASSMPTGQDFYERAASLAAQPSAWFAIALIVGGLRTLHKHHHAETAAALLRQQAITNEMARGIEQATAEIDRLERRIATDTNTLANLAHALGTLTPANQPAFLDSVSSILENVVGATSYALYRSDGSVLYPMLLVENGARQQTASLSPTPSGTPHLHDRLDPMPQWTPIRNGVDRITTGYIQCTRLRATQDPRAATWLLEDFCSLLGSLTPFDAKGFRAAT